ncbi:hypothetical protein SCHPADRAFT_583321 [Schizopora paradoxa]|uniref:Uncharacterized protein n=1 Tax=Schizopora paradoxa TaxID=27342 RepID=A0A0H2RAX0_9AGAM|nr:hypothetical protein SCHPADRAFT_583321 [Schizopora paradoxa]
MTRHLKRRPPTFHLGWLIEDAVLVRLAKEGGYIPTDEGKKDVEDDDDDDEDVEFDDDDEDDNNNIEPNYIHKAQGFMNRCDELQLQVFPGLASVYDSSTKTVSYAVSIMTNFQTGTGRWNPEDCDKLVREFKFEGEPKWYLDYEKWHWRKMK